MLKQILRPLVPPPMLEAWRRRTARRLDEKFAQWTPAEVFGAIYRDKLWGSAPELDYCSGTGGHERTIFGPMSPAFVHF
jgi:hypothetical protein